jgi:WD40 repeat protein
MDRTPTQSPTAVPRLPTKAAPSSRPSVTKTTPPRSTTARSPDETPNAVPIDVVQQFDDLRWNIHSLAFSPDDRWLAAGKLDRSIVLLDVESGNKLDDKTDLNDFGQVVQVSFSRDGKTLVAAGYQGVVASIPINPAGFQ